MYSRIEAYRNRPIGVGIFDEDWRLFRYVLLEIDAQNLEA
jgi:hypothetical protein